jgi:hypothetical protein
MNYKYLQYVTILIVITIVIIGYVNQIKAQNRTWINYELGIATNNQSWNTQLNIDPQKSNHSIVGGLIEQELSRFLSVEAGVNDKFYGFDAYYYGSDTVNIMSHSQYLGIPLRLRTRINILKEKLFISPHIGLTLLCKSYSGVEFYPDNGEFTMTIKSNYPQTTILFESGISLECILKSWKFGFMITSNMSRRDFMNYTIDNKDTYFVIDGSYFTYSLRIGYAISNIWKKKNNSTQLVSLRDKKR